MVGGNNQRWLATMVQKSLLCHPAGSASRRSGRAALYPHAVGCPLQGLGYLPASEGGQQDAEDWRAGSFDRREAEVFA